MKKFELVLKDNEELIVDCDDLMEQELVKFHESIKGLTLKEARKFENWIKVYKLLNYDIIDGLEVDKVYRFSKFAAVIELTFRGHKEYDLLNLNPETMTVAVMNVKEKSVRPYIVRRLLIPHTVEQALAFAKAPLPEEGVKAVSKTIKDLEVNGSKYDVTEHLNLNNEEFTHEEEPKQEEPKVTEEPKQEEDCIKAYKRRMEQKYPGMKFDDLVEEEPEPEQKEETYPEDPEAYYKYMLEKKYPGMKFVN